jgi:hypothetical protein
MLITFIPLNLADPGGSQPGENQCSLVYRKKKKIQQTSNLIRLQMYARLYSKEN